MQQKRDIETVLVHDYDAVRLDKICSSHRFGG